MASKPIRQASLLLPLVLGIIFRSSFPALSVDIAGKIKGRVVDPSGALIPGATITARESRTHGLTTRLRA